MHTKDLPNKNATVDMDIIKVADAEKRIIASKDSDFQKQYVLFGRPERLLMIATGNILNKELITLFEENFDQIEVAFEAGNTFVELNNTTIIIYA